VAIRAEEKFENVKRSLYNHIEANYTETAKDFAGSNALDTTGITEWAWFGITGATGRRFMRHTQATVHGDLVQYLLTVIINVHVTDYVTRIDRIRDVVINLLRRPSIQIVDYVETQANLGKLLGQGIFSEGHLDAENDVQRYSLIFLMQYMEEYDR